MNKRKLQIFVSSTFTDLKADRQAAVAAILKAGHIPAGMELFSAGDRSQWDTIKGWIDESDGYMLILGGRYGTIETTTGISYTELEYDYASQQGKPLFAVVITDKALEARVLSSGTTVIEQDEPKALKLFREKVLSNVSSFFEDEKDIKLCVHESLSDMRDNPAVVGWVSASEAEDTKPLHEELIRLRKENDKFKAEIAKQIKPSAIIKSIISDSEVTDLVRLLSDTTFHLPSTVAKPDDNERDLLSLFVNGSQHLINGVTNAINTDDWDTFLYFNVCPKLMMHGLVANEKVPGVKYRRSYVTDRGMAFLAEVDKRLHKGRVARKKTAASAAVDDEVPKADKE